MQRRALSRATIVIICGALIVTVSMGIRQAFGIFLQPVSQDLGAGREVFSLAIALQNLVFGLPLAGLLADRFGPRWMVLGGGVLYVIGLVLVPIMPTPGGLSLTLGILLGLALSSTSYVVVLGAVAQAVPIEKRTTAFGITTAAGSFGMFAMVPVAQFLLANMSWQQAFLVLAVCTAAIIALAFGFPRTAANTDSAAVAGGTTESLAQTLAKAQRHGGYWLLNAGFFVCGFHVAFIATHLPAFLNDNAVAPMAGATALGLIGFSNIFGSYLFGRLGDIYRKKYLLGFLYLTRSMVIGLFLLLPISNITAIIFGATIGFLWLATVPLTSGMVAQIFGSRYLSTLYGIVFLSHQVGSFLGVWLGGRVYDTTGSYMLVWLAAIALGVMAAALHLPIAEDPPARRAVPHLASRGTG